MLYKVRKEVLGLSGALNLLSQFNSSMQQSVASYFVKLSFTFYNFVSCSRDGVQIRYLKD